MTFPQYRQLSGWNALLPPRADIRVLRKEIDVDVAIVGAGYTGIAAAKRWHEIAPADEIAIIDSSVLGEGSPGRNSGFLLEIALANDAQPKQIQRMQQCNQLIAGAMNKIRLAVEESDIDCQLEHTGTYRAAAGSVGAKALEQYRAFLQAADLPFENLDRNSLQQRLGTSHYQDGLYSPHCYLAQPAALIKALSQQLADEIQLYENTPATQIQKVNDHWLIETPEGEIKAKKIILANNAFSKMLGVGKSRMVAIYTYAGLTPPLDNEALDLFGSDKSWGLLPTHRLGSTLRKTADGRLMIRSQYDYEKEIQTELVSKELKKKLLTRYPKAGELEFEHVWGGAVGFTLNGGAIWGEIKPGLFASSGCNGGGVVKGTLFGELLADLANGKSVPDVSSLFGKASWMPGEPFREIGFRVISALEKYRGRAEL